MFEKLDPDMMSNDISNQVFEMAELTSAFVKDINVANGNETAADQRSIQISIQIHLLGQMRYLTLQMLVIQRELQSMRKAREDD